MAVAVIILTPQCSVDRQTLIFDIEQYVESPDPDTCAKILARIMSYNDECQDSMALDCV